MDVSFVPRCYRPYISSPPCSEGRVCGGIAVPTAMTMALSEPAALARRPDYVLACTDTVPVAFRHNILVAAGTLVLIGSSCAAGQAGVFWRPALLPGVALPVLWSAVVRRHGVGGGPALWHIPLHLPAAWSRPMPSAIRIPLSG